MLLGVVTSRNSCTSTKFGLTVLTNRNLASEMCECRESLRSWGECFRNSKAVHPSRPTQAREARPVIRGSLWIGSLASGTINQQYSIGSSVITADEWRSKGGGVVGNKETDVNIGR
jgi:hypothetical protein